MRSARGQWSSFRPRLRLIICFGPGLRRFAMRIAPSPHRPRDLRLGLIFILTCLGAVVPAIAGAATPAHLWSQRFGDNNENYARAVATDAAGNVYLAGDAYGTFSFGGSNLTCF